MNDNPTGTPGRAWTTQWIPFCLAAVIVFIAAYMRIVVAQDTVVVSPVYGDALEYYNYAYNLKRHGVYSIQNFASPERPVPDAQRSPGYALFLMLFVERPPLDDMVVRIVWAQVALSVVTLLLALVLFRSFLAWHWTLLAALFVALSPHLIVANVYVLTETLFTMLLTGFLAALGWFARRPHWSKALFAGCLLGAALLVRPTLQYFFILLIPALFVLLPWKRAAATAIALMLGFVLAYGPWLVRNQTLPDDALSSKALDTVHKGMYPDLMFRGDPRTYGFPNRADPGWGDRAGSSTKVLTEIRRRFEAEPVRYARWYLVGKPVTFLSWGMVVGMGDVFVYPVSKSPYFQLGFFDVTHRLMRGLHWPVTMLALLGCVLAWLPGARKYLSEAGLLLARVAALVMGYFLLVHIAGTPLPRYAVPLKPLVFGLGVLGGVLMHRFLADLTRKADRGKTS